MVRTTQNALISANRDFNHTISAQVIALNAKGAVMACYIKVPVGQEVFVRVGDVLFKAVVIPYENIRALLASSPSPQIARYQGFAVKFLAQASASN